MVYQVAYLTYFKMNQEEIAKAHCVNKGKPELECNGQCHLKKELEKVQIFEEEGQEEESPNRLPELEWNVLVAIFPDGDTRILKDSNFLSELRWHIGQDVLEGNVDAIWMPPRVG